MDIEALITIHNHAFPYFFLTSLGNRFLSLYYDTVRKSEKGVLLGCYIEGRLVGFCAATLMSASFYSRLVKDNLLLYMLEALRLLFTRPKAVIRLYRNLTKKPASINDKGDYAELLSIGVDVDYQGEGVGRTLLCELEKVVESNGGHAISLTTDYDNNFKVQSFYSSLGYRIYYDFIAYPQRRMYRYIKDLNKY